LLQGLALEEFHDQIRVAVACCSNVVQRADVWMRESGDGLGFSLEPVSELLVVGDPGREDFDRDRPIEAGVARSVHLAHSAFAQLCEDLVGTESLTD
jgi:hypothetical protein